MPEEERQPPYPADTRARGWRFELDYEQIDQSDTWDMAAEIPMAQHALLMMWLISWRQEPCGSFPNDEAVIRAKCRMPPKVWAQCRDVLMRGWWLASDGRLYHDTIATRVFAMLDKRANDAQRAATRRARKADATVSTEGVTPESRVTHTGVPPEFDTKHQAPSTSTTPSLRSGVPRGARLPKPFELPPEYRTFCETERPDLNPEVVAAKFADYWHSKPGKAGTKLDWLATWRNWVRDEKAATPTRGAAPAGQSFAERDREAGMQRWEQMTGRAHPDRQQSAGVVIDMPTNQLALGGRS